MRIGVDDSPIADTHAWAKKHVGLDQHVATDVCIECEPDRIRVDQGGAFGHGVGAGAALENAFRQRQVGARVDTQHLLFLAGDRDGAATLLAHDGNGVGQVKFT